MRTTSLPNSTHQPIRIGHTYPEMEWAGSDGAEPGGVVRYLVHRHLRYLFKPSVGKFVLLWGLDGDHTSSDLHEMRGGLSLEQHSQR